MKSLGKIWPLLIILPFILSPTPHIAFQTQFLSMSSLQPLQKMINQDSFSQWWQTTGNAAHDNEDSSEQRLEIQDYRIQKGDSIDKNRREVSGRSQYPICTQSQTTGIPDHCW